MNAKRYGHGANIGAFPATVSNIQSATIGDVPDKAVLRQMLWLLEVYVAFLAHTLAALLGWAWTMVRLFI